MYEILIDEHRHIYGVVFVSSTLTDEQKAEKRARLAHYREQCVNAGHTPRVHSQANLPADFAVGRVLSADGSAAAHPINTHQPNLIRDRRDQVVRWAIDNTKLGFLLLALRDINAARNSGPESDDLAAGRPPFPSAIYLAFVQSTLAAAHKDANIVNTTVWDAVKHNIKHDKEDMNGISSTQWREEYPRMEAYSAFFKAGSTLAANPSEVRLITPVGADTIEWANGMLFGARR